MTKPKELNNDAYRIINVNTGEIVDSGIFKSYEQLNRERKFAERQANRELQKEKNFKEYGDFIWLLYTMNTKYNPDLSPSDTTRLMLIATYMNYDNKLIFENNRPITKENINLLLKISDRECKYFYKTMIDNNIFYEKDNCLYINTKYFYKGKMGLTPIRYDASTTRLYVNGVRAIYEQATPRAHKQLGYVFAILPYVNIDYNMVCTNPKETNLDSVCYLTLGAFCEIIDYDLHNIRKLINSFKECISIHDEYVINFVYNGSYEDMKIYVNPRIYYAGSKWDKVKILGSFSKKSKFIKGHSTGRPRKKGLPKKYARKADL